MPARVRAGVLGRWRRKRGDWNALGEKALAPSGLGEHPRRAEPARVWGHGWGHPAQGRPLPAGTSAHQSATGSTGPSWAHTEPLKVSF